MQGETAPEEVENTTEQTDSNVAESGSSTTEQTDSNVAGEGVQGETAPEEVENTTEETTQTNESSTTEENAGLEFPPMPGFNK